MAELLIHFQLIANGVILENGVAVPKLVAREFKLGLERGYRLHDLEVFFALGTLLNQKHVMYKIVQVKSL